MKIDVPRYGTEVIGLPPRAVVLTNSERTDMACPLRWLFRHGDRLRPESRQAPLEMGSAVHAAIEDVHLWWMRYDTRYPGDGTGCVWCGGDGRVGLCQCHNDGRCGSGDCKVCDGTGRGPVARAAQDWRDYALADETGWYDPDQAEADAERLRRIVVGWLFTYKSDPPKEYRVVAPELRIAVPVLGPSGKVYAPRTWVVPDRQGWRMAGTGEAHVEGAKLVRWPLYQCLTLDALLEHRTSGALYVYEAKTARSPERRLANVSIDPQVSGYVYAAQQVVDAGLIPDVATGARVAGYIYDVLYNGNQPDPKLLTPTKVQQVNNQGEPLFIEKGELKPERELVNKGRRKAWVVDSQGEPVLRSPGLSRSESAGVPSWFYRHAIDRHGFDPNDYADHLLTIMQTVDPRLYVRDVATSGPEVGARYARELYPVATQLAAWRRRAAELRTPEDRDCGFPRQPVPCIQGYGCAYRAPCLQDGALVRQNFTTGEPVRWLTDSTTNNNDGDTQADSKEVLGW